MKNTFKNIRLFQLILILGILLGNTSCENVLQEKPYSFLAKETFYTNAGNAEAAIIGIYNGLVISPKIYGRWYFDFLLLSDDQVTIHRNPLFLQIDNFNLTADHAYLTELWGGIYTVIDRANVAITRIPGIDMDEGKRNSLVAEARFIRASMYFTLVRLWGAVPLSINEVKNEESANVPKASVDEIYKAIIADLEFAEKYLPQKRNSGEFGRVTQGAAKAIFTDVLLTRESWAAAAAKAKEIIESGQYSLLGNFKDIFSVSNETNAEIIYSIIYDGANFGNWMASFSHNGGTDNANCYNGAHVWEVDEKSDMWLNWNNNDPRKIFSVSDKYLSRSGTYKSLYGTANPYPEFGKWNAPRETSTEKCPLNPIIYRYADVLLMYAEALSQANNGPNQAAYDAINMVRRRGYGQTINQTSVYDLQSGLDAITFRNLVIKERSYEFVVEGKRLFDLLRTKQFPQILIDMGKSVNPAAKLFPIPQAEIDANSNLSKEDQNEGY